jgi:sialate O-acetylesterase
MQRLKLLFLLTFILSSHVGFCKIVFPTIIGDNMVLQRQSIVPLWGTANKNTAITVQTSWDKKIYKTKSAADGKWNVPVSTPSAGGPYTITFSDGQPSTLKNILIGEVWLCSGQSNMEMPVKGFKNQPVLNSNEIAVNSENPNIRIFLLEKALSRTPLETAKGSWTESNAATSKEFSAIGFQFAQMLQEKLKVPVGIIGTYWGGTPIQAWMDKNSLGAFPEMKIPVPGDTAKLLPNVPTSLYNAMINPVVGYGLKGFLWYQGESNVSGYSIYEKLMKAMVAGWRKSWKNDSASFYYVQIAPYTYGADTGRKSAYLRESQLNAASSIPDAGMAVAMDVGTQRGIHPPDKTTVSKRLLYLALAKTYHKPGIAFSGPVYKSMKTDGNKINIYFNYAENGITTFGKELSNFEISGADKVFYPATAKITNTGVTVQSDKVQEPVAVRYGFKDWVVGELYNDEGLPASSFRTDDW